MSRIGQVFPLIAMAFAAPAPAKAAGPASAAPPAAPAAVPRPAFIATMNSEFAKMDADGDGIVTRKEVENFQRAAAQRAATERLRQMFAALDTNHDGKLSLQEFSALHVALPKGDAASIFAQADLNRDGKITLIEYRTAKLANFDRMDADKDGIVSVAEMKAAGLVK